MRIFSRFLSRSTHPDITKSNAVFTVLSLIALAYFFAFTIALAAPNILSKVLPNNATEDMKFYASLALLFLTTGGFTLFCWDMVNDRVRSAIKADVEVKERSLEEDFKLKKEELEVYRRENSEKEYFKRQNLEFQAVTGANIYHLNPSLDKISDQAFRTRMARDTIIKGLAYDDEILRKLAIEASKKALNKSSVSGNEANKDKNLTIFRQDIFIYLKSWLMFSVTNGREMDVSVVKQRCRGKSIQYIEALSYIRETLIKKRQVVEKLESPYKNESIQMLEEYLDKLIKSLR